MKSDSLTRQTIFLLVGRILSMPLAFLVPVVLTRVLSVEDFGVYKQVFMIFAVLVPIVDFGITNSLYYLIPKFPDNKNAILLNTLVLQILIGAILLIVLAWGSDTISRMITGDVAVGNLLELIGLSAIIWNVSNIIEVLLIVEKKSAATGVVVFISEILRSGVIIIIGVLGGDVVAILYGLICVCLCRLLALLLYLMKQYKLKVMLLDRDELVSQMSYALPFGAAVIISGFVANVHQFIVSNSVSVQQFAIFSIGCFQLPFLAILVDSVARTSLVRIAELRNAENSSNLIAGLISECCRKLWLLLFPLFIFLLVIAEPFIILLFTESYRESVPVFRAFIWVIPVSAILVQHVLRAYEKTQFIMYNNLFCLFVSFIFCLIGLHFGELIGAAAGFVLGQLVWKILFVVKCQCVLEVNIGQLIPIRAFAASSATSIICAVPVLGLVRFIDMNNLIILILATVIYWIPLIILYWFWRVMNESEKVMCRLLCSRLFIKLVRL